MITAICTIAVIAVFAAIMFAKSKLDSCTDNVIMTEEYENREAEAKMKALLENKKV